ncbi:MAG: hypothetical protein O7G83_21250, partial [Proteobacteria bacterium]|nr:hypothetical protein [Pseudomonadota bacterium]
LTVGPDSRMVATSGGDALVRIWDARSGKPLHTLKGHRAEVIEIGFSGDGSRLVSLDKRSDVFIWDLARGAMVKQLAPNLRTRDVALNLDGRLLASCGDGGVVRLTDVLTESTVWLAEAAGAYSVHVSDEYDRLMAMTFGRTLVFDLKSGASVLAFEDPRQARDYFRRFLANGGRNGSGSADPFDDNAIPLGGLVQELFQEHHFADLVVQALRKREDLSDSQKQTCIAQARVRAQHPMQLRQEAWRMAMDQNQPKTVYESALAKAKSAAEMVHDGWYLRALGLAQYRMGLASTAITTLQRADDLERFSPSTLAILAMAQSAADRESDAALTFERSSGVLHDDQLMRSHRAPRESIGDIQSLLQEAKQAVKP